MTQRLQVSVYKICIVNETITISISHIHRSCRAVLDLIHRAVSIPRVAMPTIYWNTEGGKEEEKISLFWHIRIAGFWMPRTVRKLSLKVVEAFAYEESDHKLEECLNSHNERTYFAIDYTLFVWTRKGKSKKKKKNKQLHNAFSLRFKIICKSINIL